MMQMSRMKTNEEGELESVARSGNLIDGVVDKLARCILSVEVCRDMADLITVNANSFAHVFLGIAVIWSCI